MKNLFRFFYAIILAIIIYCVYNKLIYINNYSKKETNEVVNNFKIRTVNFEQKEKNNIEVDDESTVLVEEPKKEEKQLKQAEVKKEKVEKKIDTQVDKKNQVKENKKEEPKKKVEIKQEVKKKEIKKEKKIDDLIKEAEKNGKKRN